MVERGVQPQEPPPAGLFRIDANPLALTSSGPVKLAGRSISRFQG
jgi:hypothetical protein